MALGMSPGKAQAYGQGAVAGDVDPDPSVGFGPAEAPEGKPEQNIVQKTVNVVKGLFSDAGQKSKQKYGIKGTGIPSSQNFFQKNKNMQALLEKGYTISDSGNALYAPYNENLISAREIAENEFTGIPNEVAFRSTAASIDPTTGMMFSGGVKGGALDRLTSSMITPSRAKQNISRTNKYKAQSDAALAGLLTPEQREANKKSSFFGFDLDGDGNPFTSTNDAGVVFGMSNKAIYDPNIQDSAYRGIPESYATGSVTQNPTTGALGTYTGQEESDDRMLFNEFMGMAMPLAGVAKLGNYANSKLFGKPEVKQGMTDSQFDSFINEKDLEYAKLKSSLTPKVRPYQFDSSNTNNQSPYSSGVTTINLENLEESDSNFINFTGNDIYGNPMYSNNPIVGYQADGTTPIYADDPNANQVPYMSVYP